MQKLLDSLNITINFKKNQKNNNKNNIDNGLHYLLGLSSGCNLIPNTNETINNYYITKNNIIPLLNNNKIENYNKLLLAYKNDRCIDIGPNFTLTVISILNYSPDEIIDDNVLIRMHIEDNICFDWFANIANISRIYE